MHSWATAKSFFVSFETQTSHKHAFLHEKKLFNQQYNSNIGGNKTAYLKLKYCVAQKSCFVLCVKQYEKKLQRNVGFCLN